MAGGKEGKVKEVASEKNEVCLKGRRGLSSGR
jgi:hypothetical protein